MLTSVVGESKPTVEASVNAWQTFWSLVMEIPNWFVSQEVSHNRIAIVLLKNNGYDIIWQAKKLVELCLSLTIYLVLVLSVNRMYTKI